MVPNRLAGPLCTAKSLYKPKHEKFQTLDCLTILTYARVYQN
jgi:hypothetical protein